MISVVSHNCKEFINQNQHDSRAEMLVPLAVLTDYEKFDKEGIDSIQYKKACDLYNYLTGLPEENRYKCYSLLVMELKLKYNDKALKKYGLLTEDEKMYIIDFIDTYGGFRVFH